MSKEISSTSDHSDDDVEQGFYAQRFVDHKFKAQNEYVFVKWYGWHQAYCAWEPAANLS
jgi:hypothetical protein